jgi:hypothetical protein
MSCQTNDEYLKYLVGLFTAASTVRDTAQQRQIAKVALQGRTFMV